MKPVEILKVQSSYPRYLIPWGGVGDTISMVLYKTASMLPKDPSFVPDIGNVPIPPIPPWSK